MNEILTPPPEAKPRRRKSAAFSNDPEKRAIQIGVLGTILVHLLVLILAPYLSKLEAERALRKQPEPAPFNVDFLPEEPNKAPQEQPKPPPPNKFVEANPDAPDNVPDKTNNFSFMNQQVAQQKP